MQLVVIQRIFFTEALKFEVVFPGTTTQAEKTEMMGRARQVIFVCLRDEVLRKVTKATTTTSTWFKLKVLYMTKSLAHRLRN